MVSGRVANNEVFRTNGLYEFLANKFSALMVLATFLYCVFIFVVHTNGFGYISASCLRVFMPALMVLDTILSWVFVFVAQTNAFGHIAVLSLRFCCPH